MISKLPVISSSKSSKNENKPPISDSKSFSKPKKDSSAFLVQKNTRPIPINCVLTVEEMIKEAVNNLIHEYLLKMNFPITLEKFKDELSASKPVSIENYQDNLRSLFKMGQKEKFFELWTHFIPISLRMHDKEIIKTEFFIMLYFIFYRVNLSEKERKMRLSGKNSRAESRDQTYKEMPPFHPPAVVSFQTSLSCAIDEFRNYLVKNGEEFSKIEDLLPYYALPYIKEPFNHPLFKEVLGDGWNVELSKKLDLVLNSLYSPKSKPYLLQMYEASFSEVELNPDRPIIITNNNNSSDEKDHQGLKPIVEDESCKKRSFHSFKDKTKSPLMNVILKKNDVISHFVPSDSTHILPKFDQNVHIDQKVDIRPPESPSKAIQVKNYIKRIETENKKLSETIDILSKKCEQNELKIADLQQSQKKLKYDIKKEWSSNFDGLFEVSSALLKFGNMFRPGREIFLETAEKRINEYKKFVHEKNQNSFHFENEKVPQNYESVEPFLNTKIECNLTEIKQNLIKHISGDIIRSACPFRR